jgi:hypothetical protein
MQFRATAKPARFAKDIVWMLAQPDAGKVTYTPANRQGPKLTVALEGLPSRNSGFGPQSIEAGIDAKGCKATASRTVRLFYPRDATNNPGSKQPNWFYYWSQTSARSGAKPAYGARAGKCAASAVSNDPDAFGYYPPSSLPSHYYICDLTKFGAEMTAKLPFWSFQKNAQGQLASIAPNVKTLTGIDTFAVTSLHESEHMRHLRLWWRKPNGQIVRRIDRRQTDADGDDMPDAAELAFNAKHGAGILSPKNKRSQQGIDDEEFFTQLVHTRWTIGSADKEDWSRPGKQWPK